MTTASVTKQNDHFWKHLGISLLLMIFICSLDNDSTLPDWFKSVKALIFFTVYSLIILFGQALTQVIILGWYKGKYKFALTCLIGIPLGVALLFTFFYFLRH
ncbi:MAG TPA: hypothetical protein VNY73_09310 [Bacteroidia bacterium]|jgi:hypothetical protein|nr:hypothetical protein [Bacteroidia bacterium]